MKFLIAFLALIALVAATGELTANTTTSTTTTTTEMNKIAQDSTNGTARAGENVESKDKELPKTNGASQIQMSALFAAVPVLVAMKFF